MNLKSFKFSLISYSQLDEITQIGQVSSISDQNGRILVWPLQIHRNREDWTSICILTHEQKDLKLAHHGEKLKIN